MVDYYQILGIGRDAGPQEVKRAYRRLAMLYHPDKNPDPLARQVFLQVQQAYQVLSDPDRRRHYDLTGMDSHRRRGHYAQAETAEERRERIRRQQQQRARAREEFIRRRAEKREAYFRRFLKLSRRICLLTLSFVLLLVVDYFLPPRVLTEQVISRESSLRGMASDIVRTPSHNFPLDRQFMQMAVRKGNYISIEESRLFRSVLRLLVDYRGTRYATPPHYSIYNAFLFALVVIGLSSGFGLWVKNDSELVSNLAFLSAFMTALTVYFMLV